MRIAVCIKQVPGTTAVEVDPVTGTLKRDGVESKLNPYDLYALEAALMLKEKYANCEVWAFTMGPPQAAAVLEEALMMGVDEVCLVSDRKFGGADVLATSFALSQALETKGAFDLIICGRQTTDGDTAQVGAEIAEFLGIPHAASVIRIDAANEDSLELTGDLPLCTFSFRIPFPALISVEKSIGEPRLPSYKRKLACAGKKPCCLTLADMKEKDESFYGQKGSPTRVVRIFPPEHNTKQEFWEGTDAGEKLYNHLLDNKFLQEIK